jgi:hypothetical protein
LNIIKAYRSTKISTRVIILCLVLILGSVISWVNGTNILLTAGSIAAAGALIEGLLVHHRKMLTVGILILHLVALSFYTLTFYTIYTASVTEETGIFVAGTVFITGIVTSLFAMFLCSKIAYGKFWINILISFILYYISLTVTITLLPQLTQLIPIAIAFVVVMAYPALNHLVGRKRAYKYDVEKFPKNKKQTILANKLPEAFSSIQKIDLETNPYIQTYRNRKGVILAVPLAGDKSVEIENNMLKVDGEDTTWILEYVLESSKEFSRNYRIRQKKLVPVIIVNGINLPRGITPINVKARNKPDKTIGTVLICKLDKTNLLIRQLNDMPELSNKEMTILINSN